MSIGSIVMYKEFYILRTGLFAYRVLTPDGIYIWTVYTRSGAHNLVDSFILARGY